jgi:hypothetical protein
MIGRSKRAAVEEIMYALEFLQQNHDYELVESGRVKKWQKPPEGKFKVNVAKKSFFEYTIGVGVVEEDNTYATIV